jgi:small subunit ribosomal protein S16
VAVKIRLKRLGKIRSPHYRIVVADSRTKRDGRAIEEIGKYHPKNDPSVIEVDSERAQYWLSVGAQPTEPVAAILKVTGDWQKFRGEPGAEGTLRVAEARVDKKVAFESAAKESHDDTKDGATTPRKKAAKKVAAAAADGTPAARPTADEAAAEGNTRAAGSDGADSADTAGSDAAPAAETPSTDETPAAASDDAAKGTVGSAQGAPAIEETTDVTATETVKDEG